jgi:hypothetical protein
MPNDFASKCEIILTLNMHSSAPRRSACAARHALPTVVHTLPSKKKNVPNNFFFRPSFP